MTESDDSSSANASPPAKSGTEKDRSGYWIAAGAAMGIGSAALVAALLYSNRDKKDAKRTPKLPTQAPESD